MRAYTCRLRRPAVRAPPGPYAVDLDSITGAIMGKYVLAWILGVPAIVLVAIYFFAH
jgi:hypothetical protein